MKKKELKNNQKKIYWGNFILIFLLFLVIKFGIQNDWFVKKTKNNLNNKTSGMCKLLSMTKEECNIFERSGYLPEKYKNELNKMSKEKIVR